MADHLFFWKTWHWVNAMADHLFFWKTNVFRLDLNESTEGSFGEEKEGRSTD